MTSLHIFQKQQLPRLPSRLLFPNHWTELAHDHSQLQGRRATSSCSLCSGAGTQEGLEMGVM